MRRRLVLTVLLSLSACASLPAAPLDTGAKAAPPALDNEEAGRFASELVLIADQIARQYLRPIPRSRLLFAGLSGLYEEVQVPVPENLLAKLEEAMKATGPDTDSDEKVPDRDVDGTPLAVTPITREVVRVRQALGNRPTLRPQAGLRQAVQGMMKALDPYSKVVDGQELRRSSGDDLNRGIGVELATEEVSGPVRIKTVVLGSPAQRAGIRPGDRISHIDGKPVDGAQRNLLLLRQTQEGDETPDTKKVELTLLPGISKTPRKVTLDQRFYKPETVVGARRDPDEAWNFLLDPKRKLGYIRLGALEHGTADDLQQALLKLKADDVRGVVLDLRWSPGGFLNEAVLIARMFLNEGQIATVKSRARDDDQVYRVQAESPWGQLPLIVLVNGETSGGSELIAAALQDNKRAKIVGQRTFGKGSVQTMLALPFENAGVKLTSGNFIRPSGKALHRFPDSRPTDAWGVHPDEGLNWPISADLSKQLQEWWLLQSLRPSRADDVLPLDDPEKDPQRQAAVAALVKQLK